MPDKTPARIRWLPNPGGGQSGYAGAIDEALFRILDPEGTETEHMLITPLPGMSRKIGHGTEAEVKAQAEDWLAGHVASLGAAFPVAAGQETQQEGKGA